MLKELLDKKLKEVKPEKMEEPEEKEEHYHTFHLDSETLPEIKNWKIGEDYYVVMKVTQTSMDAYKNKEEEKYHCCFEIKEIGVVDGKDDKESMKEEIKKKY